MRGAVEEVQRIVERLRRRWPKVKIVLRADSGFCREALMAWCEANQVDYVFGRPRNTRLRKIIGASLHPAQLQHQATGQPARVPVQHAQELVAATPRSGQGRISR